LDLPAQAAVRADCFVRCTRSSAPPGRAQQSIGAG
jgi:hypothetical protein